jgi:hypothetical protein
VNQLDNKKLNMKFKKGELIALSSGIYSDYRVNVLVRALKDFDAEAIFEEWAQDNGEKVEDLLFGKHTVKMFTRKEEGLSFIGWLNKNGFTEDVIYRELHVGDIHDGYCHLEEMKPGF